MGRLVLHVLFRLPNSSARSSPSVPATRSRRRGAKGKWSGGHPLLGYDVDPRGSKLVVNEAEAEQVRAIFTLYLEHQGFDPGDPGIGPAWLGEQTLGDAQRSSTRRRVSPRPAFIKSLPTSPMSAR